MSDEDRTFRIPFKETDGEGFTVSFTFVKDGKMYVKQIPVQRRQPDRRLNIRQRHSVTTCCREARKIGNSVLRMLIP
ncbi:MAG: hypothetical protein ACLRS8_01765 [Parabacteroides merdae]